MKTLTLLLILVSYAASGQDTTIKFTPTPGTVTGLGYNPIEANSSIATYHALMFSPIILGDTLTIKQMVEKLHFTQDEFEKIAARTTYHKDCTRCVDVGIRIYGRHEDFTFDEFRELMNWKK